MTMGLTNRGSELVIDQLATALTQKHEVMVIQSGPLSIKKYAVKRVLPLEKPPSPAPKSIFEKLAFRLHLDVESSQVIAFTKAALPILAQFAPDIIVAINGSCQLRILQSQTWRTKIIVFGHAGIGHHDRDTLRAKPDLFIALTQQAEVWAQKHARGDTKVIYIPNPIDLKKYRVSPVTLTLEHPVILTVGALSSYKNILTILAAVRQTTASLLLVGDGEQSEKIALELSTLANSFVWKKHVDPSSMPELYCAADVFCFIPDSQEAFGMVYLEAMAASLPIVASDDAIRRQIIGKKGIFVPPHNLAEIVSGIMRATTLGKVDYSEELKPFALQTVIAQVEKEFYALTK